MGLKHIDARWDGFSGHPVRGRGIIMKRVLLWWEGNGGGKTYLLVGIMWRKGERGKRKGGKGREGNNGKERDGVGGFSATPAGFWVFTCCIWSGSDGVAMNAVVQVSTVKPRGRMI